MDVTVREGVSFGRSSESQRKAWRQRRQSADGGTVASRAEARRLGEVAGAYAHGWCAGRVGADLTPESREELRQLAYSFAEEYEHAAWLYATERTYFRDGYANAWEKALASRGY